MQVSICDRNRLFSVWKLTPHRAILMTERGVFMKALKQKIEVFAKEAGMDVLGFAPKERFEGLEARRNPFTVFPEGETVIMLGKRVCRGSLRGVEEGSNFGDYACFGRNWLEDEFLALACYDLTRVLEDEGWEACPLFPNPTEAPAMGVGVTPGKEAPNVYPDFTYAAVAAGVVEVAYSGMVFSKEFGPRQRFHMVITDAKLPATPLLEQSVCDRCMQCADSCPYGAISKTEQNQVNIAGKVMTVGKLDEGKCRACKNGALPNRLHAKGQPDRMAALCNRTCICHLEEERLIGNVFENPFRTSEPWVR
ncbi:MAG TPA: hypothetical protein DER23_07100 [Clostridiales bacterium]|nr:hypothetical protein [Clostridiales bacterium]